MSHTVITSVGKVQDGRVRLDFESKLFNSDNRIFIHAFAYGIAIVEPALGTSVSELAEFIAGCFDEESKFQEHLQFAFDKKDALVGITVRFSADRKVCMTVTAENADAEKLAKEWTGDDVA